MGVTQAIPGGPYVRKAPCQFGWDWGPMLPPIGIWKDIRLEGRSAARLDDVHLRQPHAGGSVTVTAAVTAEAWSDASLTAELRLTAPDGATFTASAELVRRRPARWQVDRRQSAAVVAQRLRRPAALPG